MTVEYVDPKELKEFDYSRDLFSELKGDAYALLKADIKEHGIRTPLEVTKELLILCGHERRRIALELGLEKVPVIFFSDKDIISQKIRCIKDNLARKSVDFSTKRRCYKELKQLYGLRKQDTLKRGPVQSEERTGKLSEAEIAHEVGYSISTMNRANTIDESDLPQRIKDAAFNGVLSIRPVSDLAKEAPEIKQIVVAETLKRLDAGEDGFSVETLIRETKEQQNIQEALDEQKVPEPLTTTMRDFLLRYKEALESIEEIDTTETDIKSGVEFFKKFLNHKGISCSKCGEKHLQWKCGHDF